MILLQNVVLTERVIVPQLIYIVSFFFVLACFLLFLAIKFITTMPKIDKLNAEFHKSFDQIENNFNH